jgi:hypothetical protein
MVGTADRAEARGEFRIDFLRPAHGDRLRQKIVYATHPGLHCALDIGVEMRDLAERMDTRIGAAGTLDRYILQRKPPDGRLQRILHGKPVRLGLPALPWSAVVLDADCYAFQMFSDG